MFSTSSTNYDIDTGYLKKMEYIEKRSYLVDNSDLVFFYPFHQERIGLNGVSIKNCNGNILI